MFDYLTQAIQFMEQMQKEKKQELKQLPTGSLSSQKSSKRNRLYWTHKLGSGKYAPRKTDPLREEDFHIAQGLRQRRICILQIKAYRNNLKYAKHCLAHLIPTDYASIIKQLKEPYKTFNSRKFHRPIISFKIRNAYFRNTVEAQYPLSL